LTSHGGLRRLWVAMLRTTVERRKRLPPRRTPFLPDKVAQLGRRDLLQEVVTLLCGYGLQVWTFWQEVSPLRRPYPRDLESLLNNAAVLQTFGCQCTRRGGAGGAETCGAMAGRPCDEMLVALTVNRGGRRFTRGPSSPGEESNADVARTAPKP
jgi:type IV secretion system protein VirD4